MRSATIGIPSGRRCFGLDAFGSHQHHPRFHRDLIAFEQKSAAAFQHVIDLVDGFVSVELVFLPWLEAVESDHDPLGPEDRRLSHFLRGEDRMFFGAYRAGMLHFPLSVVCGGLSAGCWSAVGRLSVVCR